MCFTVLPHSRFQAYHWTCRTYYHSKRRLPASNHRINICTMRSSDRVYQLSVTDFRSDNIEWMSKKKIGLLCISLLARKCGRGGLGSSRVQFSGFLQKHTGTLHLQREILQWGNLSWEEAPGISLAISALLQHDHSWCVRLGNPRSAWPGLAVGVPEAGKICGRGIHKNAS